MRPATAAALRRHRRHSCVSSQGGQELRKTIDFDVSTRMNLSLRYGRKRAPHSLKILMVRLRMWQIKPDCGDKA